MTETLLTSSRLYNIVELVICEFLRFFKISNSCKREFSVTLYGREAQNYILIRKELWNLANSLDVIRFRIKFLVKKVKEINENVSSR